mmetsp:Transcript_46915/g.116943  ORF Transcript_46915/g.116943 Transcript_46915/m.116943 type:complete len:209 (+) Transcript_46915:3537-4163(+)
MSAFTRSAVFAVWWTTCDSIVCILASRSLLCCSCLAMRLCSLASMSLSGWLCTVRPPPAVVVRSCKSCISWRRLVRSDCSILCVSLRPLCISSLRVAKSSPAPVGMVSPACLFWMWLSRYIELRNFLAHRPHLTSTAVRTPAPVLASVASPSSATSHVPMVSCWFWASISYTARAFLRCLRSFLSSRILSCSSCSVAYVSSWCALRAW